MALFVYVLLQLEMNLRPHKLQPLLVQNTARRVHSIFTPLVTVQGNAIIPFIDHWCTDTSERNSLVTVASCLIKAIAWIDHR